MAIFLGSFGVIAIFYGLNILVEKTFPERLRLGFLPWIYVGPSVLLLTVYLVLPALTNLLSQLFLVTTLAGSWGLKKLPLCSDRGLTPSSPFATNLLWLVLVTGISVSLGLIIAVLIDRVK